MKDQETEKNFEGQKFQASIKKLMLEGLFSFFPQMEFEFKGDQKN